MKILIVGVSSATSIGAAIGNRASQAGHMTEYASRSGKYHVAHILDIRNELQVNRFFQAHKFDIIIHCAGVYCQTRADEEEHRAARIEGYRHLVRYGGAPIIVIGGELPSKQSEKRLNIYAQINQELVEEMESRANQDIYIPLLNIDGSTMVRQYNQYFGQNISTEYDLSEMADFVYNIIKKETEIHSPSQDLISSQKKKRPQRSREFGAT